MFWKTLVCISLLLNITAAIPQFTLPLSTYSNIQTGVPFDIAWTGASGPVTLVLMNGAASDLQIVSTIACKDIQNLIAALLYLLLLRL
jgi:hypothetical protein